MDKEAVGRFPKVFFIERPWIMIAGYLVHRLADTITDTPVNGILRSTTAIDHVAEMKNEITGRFL